MKDLTEHFVSGELVFDGKLLKVHRDRVRLPDGTETAREYIRHPGAVAVVPLFDDRRVLLERQFRYPHGREFIEVPAGKLEPNEPHLDTAKRELLEETGYTAQDWTREPKLYPRSQRDAQSPSVRIVPSSWSSAGRAGKVDCFAAGLLMCPNEDERDGQTHRCGDRTSPPGAAHSRP